MQDEPINRLSELPSRDDHLLKKSEVATILQIKESTVDDYARRGIIPSINLGRHRRFLASAVWESILEKDDRRHDRP